MKGILYNEEYNEASIQWDPARFNVAAEDLQKLAASLSTTTTSTARFDLRSSCLRVNYANINSFDQCRKMQTRKAILAFFRTREAR